MVKFYKILIWMFWSLLAFALALSTNSYYNFRSYNISRNISVLMPQGWGFFTKDPRDDDITTIYEIIDSNELKEVTISNLRSNSRGISKNNRYILYEGSQLTAVIPKISWEKQKGKVETTDSLYIITDFPNKLYFFKKNTTYLAVKKKPLPFIWANDGQENNAPYQIVKFIIE